MLKDCRFVIAERYLRKINEIKKTFPADFSQVKKRDVMSPPEKGHIVIFLY